jgi:methionine-rich copper-binding protein CopC
VSLVWSVLCLPACTTDIADALGGSSTVDAGPTRPLGDGAVAAEDGGEPSGATDETPDEGPPEDDAADEEAPDDADDSTISPTPDDSMDAPKDDDTGSSPDDSFPPDDDSDPEEPTVGPSDPSHDAGAGWVESGVVPYLGDPGLEGGAGSVFLSSTVPVAGSSNVPIDAVFTFTFNGDVVAGAGQLVLVEVFDTVTVEALSVDDARVKFDGANVTVTWTAELSYSTEYAVLVDPGAILGAGGGVFGGVTELTEVSFSTVVPEPVTLESTAPLDGAAGVPITSDITLTFSAPISAGPVGRISLIDATTLDVVQSELTSESAAVTIAGDTLTFALAASLDYATDYTVTLDASAVRSSMGATFAGLDDDSVLSFTTELPPAPLLVTTSPLDDATGVDPDTNLVLTFSAPVVVGTGTISVRAFGGDAVIESIDVGSAAVTFSDVSVTVNLASTLANSAQYYVNVEPAAIVSTFEAPYPGLSDNSTFSFTTAAAPPPPLSLVGSVPADDATDVAADTDIVLIFSEDVDVGSGSITIFRTTGNAVFETIPVGDDRVSVTDDTVTINPNGVLADNTAYYVTVGSGGFNSVRGAAFPGILDSAALNFTTDDPFVLVSTGPTDDATNVDPAVDLTLQFSETVVRGSGNIVVRQTGVGVFETVPIGDPRVTIAASVVTVDLTSTMDYAIDYHVTVEAGTLTDIDGSVFAGISGNSAWTFTTIAACDANEVQGTNGNCYYFSVGPATWDVASTACDRGPGWDLATIRSSADQTFAQSLVTAEAWIGATDLAASSEWRWVTDDVQFWNGGQSGNPVGALYNNWKSDQPTGGGQHCVRVLGSANSWEWADAFCTEEYGFLCEGPSN